MSKVACKFVSDIEVTDPDTGNICDVEVWKDTESGAMIGVDFSFLEAGDRRIPSPFNKGTVLCLQDEECDIGAPDLTPETDETKMTIEELESKYANNDWGHHPEFPREDWRAAIDDDFQTICGYWAWVWDQIHKSPEEKEEDASCR
jgi:hypothetical protein